MIRFSTRMLAAAATLVIGATALAADDYVILEVGNREIKKSEIQAVWQGLFPPGQAPDFDTVEEPIKSNVLRGAVSEYLLYDEALKAGVEDSDEVKRQLEDAKRKLIVRQFIETKSKGLVTEADVKAEYDRRVKDTRGKEEVRARHILVKTEDEAKKLKAKIDAGGDFEALAKEHSSDPGSKVQGGDLGYFSQDRMVSEFSKAAFAMKKGDVLEPVKTDFGWHVIKLVDRRDLKAPTFSELRETIQTSLTEKKLNDYVHKLIDQTDVEYFAPDGSKKEFSKVPDKSKDSHAH